MPSPDKMHNFALAAQGGTGKTTLAEAILFNAGITTRQGKVEEGNTTTDFEPEEIKRKTTINTKVVPFNWKDNKLNLADTPGYPDFFGEVVAAFRVVDLLVSIVDAASGVGIQTRKTFQAWNSQGPKPALIFINKCDRENVDLLKDLEDIKSKLSGNEVLITLPTGTGPNIKGVYNLLSGDPPPAEIKELAEKFKVALVETVAESDEQLLEKYLSAGSLTQDELNQALKKGVRNGSIVPVLAGSATKNIGVKELLDFIVTDTPAVADMPPISGTNPKTKQQEERAPKADAPFSAFVFKTTSDPGVGEIAFFRIFSGTLKAGSEVLNSTRDNQERIGQLVYMVGKNRGELTEAGPGEIIAVAKLKGTHFNDTLCDVKNPVVFPPMSFPEPMVSVAIKPATKKDQEKLSLALGKVATTDPTFKVHIDQEFSETIVSGLGEVHIDVMVEKLRSRFGIEMTLDKPKIAYRETIRTSAKAQGKHKRQTGGHGQYGDCWLELKPMVPGGGYQFHDKIFGGAIPGKFVPSVEKGVKESMKAGILAGYPVVDIDVTVYDGSYHDVDSSDMAFQIAGSMGFKNALQAAKPILLEPVMAVEITIPDQYFGDITGNLNSRRGKVQGMTAEGGMQTIKAQVPLAEMHRYSSDLRSLTQGSGSFTMAFSHYEEVPGNIAKKIIEEAAARKAAEHKEG